MTAFITGGMPRPTIATAAVRFLELVASSVLQGAAPIFEPTGSTGAQRKRPREGRDRVRRAGPAPARSDPRLGEDLRLRTAFGSPAPGNGEGFQEAWPSASRAPWPGR